MTEPHRSTAYFDYDLPPERIAQHPVEPRDSARLLVDRLDGPAAVAGAGPIDSTVAALAQHLEPGDLVVVNDTRVSPARLLLTKATGGKVEVLLLDPFAATGEGRATPGGGDEVGPPPSRAGAEPGRAEANGPVARRAGAESGGAGESGSERHAGVPGAGEVWSALVRGGRRVRPGTELFAGDEAVVTVGDDLGEGRRAVTILADDVATRAGRIPLPPYIHAALDDDERYQTVYAERPGSVAAPTAGLHLTTGLLDRLAAAGIGLVRVELQVGLGTFRPITADRVDEHHMHEERYRIEPAAWERITAADRVVAVGTTVVRTLESAAATGELAGSTGLFINRGHRWRVVDTLLTNFHVPRSSLLVLVDAFVGPRWRELYDHALATGYRFLSFGDAMLVDRRHAGGS